MSRCLLVCTPIFILVACGVDAPPGPKVLFVGSSYIYVNDLPHMFSELAKSGGHPTFTAMSAPWGLNFSLAQHADDPWTDGLIRSARWDYVVLQENSVDPINEAGREQRMYPAIRKLNDKIVESGSHTMLFQTWGRVNEGLEETGFSDFASNQDALTAGHRAIAEELNIPVASVGEAWRAAVAETPNTALWKADGSHPSPMGTYLTACVFYASIYGESPEGLAYTGGLASDVSSGLQRVAAKTVLARSGEVVRSAAVRRATVVVGRIRRWVAAADAF